MNMPASPYIVVIGSLNTDIGGHTSVPFKRADSNPGRITKTYGGTGHNIACNISLMGFPVKFITAFGDESDELRAHCADMGLDVSESLTVPGGQSSTYLYIDDSNGEMIAAVSDMEIYSEITVDFIKYKMDVLNGALVVVFDTNIPQETIEYIAENCTRPLVCDPVSTSKAKKLKNCLGHIAALKPKPCRGGGHYRYPYSKRRRGIRGCGLSYKSRCKACIFNSRRVRCCLCRQFRPKRSGYIYLQPGRRYRLR